jgi:hypothetical protein
MDGEGAVGGRPIDVVEQGTGLRVEMLAWTN